MPRFLPGMPKLTVFLHRVTMPPPTAADPSDCTTLAFSLLHVHTVTHSPFTKLDSNDSLYVGHLFSVRTLMQSMLALM